MSSLAGESGHVKDGEVAWYAMRKGALVADYAGSATAARLAGAEPGDLRIAIANCRVRLADLDRHAEWSAGQIATARALIREMDAAAEQLEREKGCELRARFAEGSTQ